MCNYSGSDVVFMAKRIGVFGGSFNPLHIGHLIVAEAAWQEFNLEQVVFVPTGDTPHKNMHHISKIDRFEMVKMAIKENPHFSISSIEIERKGLSYTVDTIKQLHAEWGSEYNIYFIAGTDAIADMPTWKYNEELLDSCHFICASRPSSEERIKQAVAYFGKKGCEKIHFLRTPELEISSTILRKWIASNRSVKYMIPDSVIQYINIHNLYKDEE